MCGTAAYCASAKQKGLIALSAIAISNLARGNADFESAR
jgi:hypothetical protein